MPNKLTGGTAIVGGLRTIEDGAVKLGSGKVVQSKSNTFARTDTAAKTLFSIPALSEIIAIVISGNTPSNAGTTAVVDIGKTGTADFFIADYDLLTTSGTGVHVPAALNMGSVGSAAINVIATYAETGGASNAGGPWTVTAFYTNESKI
jgi:hypothetical protein